jgi:hypothetical protein
MKELLSGHFTWQTGDFVLYFSFICRCFSILSVDLFSLCGHGASGEGVREDL